VDEAEPNESECDDEMVRLTAFRPPAPSLELLTDQLERSPAIPDAGNAAPTTK
jgi:hypothetical protein